jgi:hypothetical protein
MTTVLRDYQHAARIFTDSQFRLSPKYGFLFYVEFDFDPNISNITSLTAQEMGMLVKSVNLPKYTIQVKEHNAYNRKNYVQNSIRYDPVTITFHDDQSDDILNFWYDYYSFYYRDSDYVDSTYRATSKYQSRPTTGWGYSPKPSVAVPGASAYGPTAQDIQPYQYIQSIRIYSLYQQQFDEYELINPVITSFRHGELANGETTSLLQHEMSVQYETVKYYSGSVTQNTAGGFIDLHYDAQGGPYDKINSSPWGNTGVVGEGSQTSIVTDFANAPIPPPPPVAVTGANGPTGSSSSISAALLSLQNSMATTQPNNGGYNIPSISQNANFNFTNGGLVAGQNLTLAGALAAQGIPTGLSAAQSASLIASKFGQTGTLLAAAVTNPNQLLKTIENSVTNLVVGTAVNVASNYINNQVNQGVSFINQNVINPLTSTISQAASDFNQSFNNALNGEGFQVNQAFGSAGSFAEQNAINNAITVNNIQNAYATTPSNPDGSTAIAFNGP